MTHTDYTKKILNIEDKNLFIFLLFSVSGYDLFLTHFDFTSFF